jgi:hypothetical protein
MVSVRGDDGVIAFRRNCETRLSLVRTHTNEPTGMLLSAMRVFE